MFSTFHKFRDYSRKHVYISFCQLQHMPHANSVLSTPLIWNTWPHYWRHTW